MTIKKVTAALLTKDGQILVAKRNAETKLANKWEFPGGKVEEGESPEECLRRELKEEFNIDVSVGEYLGDSIYEYEHGTIQLLAYWVEWRSGELELRDHEDFRWVRLEDLFGFDFAPADLPIVRKLV